MLRIHSFVHSSEWKIFRRTDQFGTAEIECCIWINWWRCSIFVQNLTKLKKLTMTDNYIETIKSSYFDYLVNLEELNLSSRFIQCHWSRFIQCHWSRFIQKLNKIETFRFILYSYQGNPKRNISFQFGTRKNYFEK